MKVSNLIFSILSDVQTCPSKEIHKLNFVKHLIYKFEKNLTLEINTNLEIELFEKHYNIKF